MHWGQRQLFSKFLLGCSPATRPLLTLCCATVQRSCIRPSLPDIMARHPYFLSYFLSKGEIQLTKFIENYEQNSLTQISATLQTIYKTIRGRTNHEYAR